MVVAHIGVAVFVVGVTLVKGYDSEKDVKLKPGESVELGGYVFRLDGVSDVRGPNYVAARARVTGDARRRGRSRRSRPRGASTRVQQMPMTEAAIDTGVTRDLYVSLGDDAGRRRAGW